MKIRPAKVAFAFLIGAIWWNEAILLGTCLQMTLAKALKLGAAAKIFKIMSSVVVFLDPQLSANYKFN